MRKGSQMSTNLKSKKKPLESKDESLSPSKKTNFECVVCDPNKGAIFQNKSGIYAHFTRLHHRAMTDKDFRMTNKPAREKTYKPEWGKKQSETRSRQGKVAAFQSQREVRGTLDIPVVLRIPFHFEVPQISQEIEPQMIEITSGRKKHK